MFGNSLFAFLFIVLFSGLLEASSSLRDSLTDICLQREFQKAVVVLTKKIPKTEKEFLDAFNAIKQDRSSQVLVLDDFKKLLGFLAAGADGSSSPVDHGEVKIPHNDVYLASSRCDTSQLLLKSCIVIFGYLYMQQMLVGFVPLI